MNADRSGFSPCVVARLRAGGVVALAGLVMVLTGCVGERATELLGVRSVSVDSFSFYQLATSDDLSVTSFTDALLRGPHYTLGIAFVATGEQLGDPAAGSLRIDPVRAAPGEQLLVAAVDPSATYAAFGPDPEAAVMVDVVVDGTATALDRLPLHDAQYGIPAAMTELILISARPEAQVRLRVTDAGRETTLDLRTGEHLTAAEEGYLQRQSEAPWDGETPVVADRFGRRVPADLSVMMQLQVSDQPAASLTTYRPDIGWAAPGRAFLSVPAPAVISDGIVSIGLHEEFDDAAVFTFRTPDGKVVPARPRMRDIDLQRSAFGERQPVVTFDVPEDIIGGTVFFDLSRAQLTEETGPATVRQASTERRSISWALPPKVVELQLDFRP